MGTVLVKEVAVPKRVTSINVVGISTILRTQRARGVAEFGSICPALPTISAFVANQHMSTIPGIEHMIAFENVCAARDIASAAAF